MILADRGSILNQISLGGLSTQYARTPDIEKMNRLTIKGDLESPGDGPLMLPYPMTVGMRVRPRGTNASSRWKTHATWHKRSERKSRIPFHNNRDRNGDSWHR